jgi:hypothetical protein
MNDRITKVFEENQFDDLVRFMKKRQCLNTSNIYLKYLFHLVQATGILTTTIATGYNYTYLIWVGVGMNITASLIHSIEQINNSISEKLLKNIQAIKENKYVDEGILIDTENSKNKEIN